MKLASIHIRHYKSLDDVTINFSDRVTILVGPNAAGKSNVVDCLRFIRDSVASDLEHAVSARGGMSRVRQYSKTKPFKVALHLDFNQDELGSAGKVAQYEFGIESLTSSNYLVDHERAVYFDATRETDRAVKRSFERDRSGLTKANRDVSSFQVAQDQLAMGRSRFFAPGTGWTLERFIRDWRFSAIYPNRLREPSTPDKDTVLSEDGRNWASVIKALRRTVRGRQALDRVCEAMRVVVPTFEEVSVASVGSYLVPNFRFGLKGKDKVTFDPVQLSDGTLRIFGILLALYQVPAPQLLVIEEPEQTVQPGVMAVLADAFAEASEQTQLIITTHSPSLIDHFKPEQVRVVTLKDGLTQVSFVKGTQMEAVKRNLMSMQDFMLAEGLQPELT
jgi:predicted ATPase